MSALLWLLICLNAAMLMWGLLDSRRLYRFTVSAAAIFCGFAIPQIIGLSSESGWFQRLVPEGALDLVVLFSILCLGAIWLGDNLGFNHPGRAAIHPLSDFDETRILQIGFALMVIGNAIFHITMSLLSEEYIRKLGTQWSGPMTIVLFFASMSKYGFAIMTLMYFRTRSTAALLCVLAGLTLNFVLFITSARRAEAASTFFILTLGLFFARRITVPAWLLGIVFAVGTLWTNSVGDFRTRDETPFLERLERAELVQNFEKILTRGGPELTNCAVYMWCVENAQEGALDFGAIHWNHLVHAYFPGQIFGAELKQEIKFEFAEQDLPTMMLNYTKVPGSTITGMADAFQSFWYFGFIKFYIIGYVMGRWYNRAMRGDLWSQLAFMALMTPALHTITHHTTQLLNNYLHMLMFAWPGLSFARLPVQPETRARSRALTDH